MFGDYEETVAFVEGGGDRSVKHSQQQINLISERLINMSKNIHLFCMETTTSE